MVDYVKNAAQKHPRAVTALKICFSAALAFLFIKLIIGSRDMEPNSLRGFLLGIRGMGAVLLGGLAGSLVDWYETLPWFTFFVNLLYISPFIGLAVSLFILFDGQQLLRRIPTPRFSGLPHLQKGSAKTNDRQSDKTRSKPVIPPIWPASPSPIDLWLKQTYQQSNILHQTLTAARDSNPYALKKPLVRVQVFASAVPKEYLLSWSDQGDASISLGSTHEIHMHLSNDEETGLLTPHIVGFDTADARTEKAFPLKKDVPLCIYRQGDSQLIRRYVITWIGGKSND